MDIERKRNDHSETDDPTDDGYSEQVLAKQFDKGQSSKQTIKNGHIFSSRKKTVFQAPKEEEI